MGGRAVNRRAIVEQDVTDMIGRKRRQLLALVCYHFSLSIIVEYWSFKRDGVVVGGG